MWEGGFLGLVHLDKGHVRYATESLISCDLAKLLELAKADVLGLRQRRRALARPKEWIVRRAPGARGKEQQGGKQREEGPHVLRLPCAARRPQTTSTPLTATQAR